MFPSDFISNWFPRSVFLKWKKILLHQTLMSGGREDAPLWHCTRVAPEEDSQGRIPCSTSRKINLCPHHTPPGPFLKVLGVKCICISVRWIFRSLLTLHTLAWAHHPHFQLDPFHCPVFPTQLSLLFPSFLIFSVNPHLSSSLKHQALLTRRKSPVNPVWFNLYFQTTSSATYTN